MGFELDYGMKKLDLGWLTLGPLGWELPFGRDWRIGETDGLQVDHDRDYRTAGWNSSQ